MSIDQELRHTYLTGQWFYCMRCDEKTKADDCQWQRGLLLCPHCIDAWPSTWSEREPAIALVLEDGKEELAPVEKLRRPTDPTEEDFALWAQKGIKKWQIRKSLSARLNLRM